jgi:hypothetical protein
MSFYNSRANELLGAVNEYQSGQNTLAQGRLTAQEQLDQGQKQVDFAKTSIQAQGKEAQIGDKIQEHMNKFFDEMGLDMSLPGVGKPLLTYAAKKAKGKAQQLIDERLKAKQPKSTPEEDQGTELKDFEPTDPDSGGVPRERFGDEPEDEDEGPLDEPQPPEGEPVEARAPTDVRNGTGDESIDARNPALDETPLHPDTQAALDRGEPVEVDAFDPASAPIIRKPDPIPEFSEDPGDVPIQPGLAGPGYTPAPIDDPLAGLGPAPPSISGTGMNYADERAIENNPFRFGGSRFDSSLLRRGPPAAQPEYPDVDFSGRAAGRVQPPTSKAAIDDANQAGGDGLDSLAPLRQEFMARSRARQDGTSDEFSADRIPEGAGGRAPARTAPNPEAQEAAAQPQPQPQLQEPEPRLTEPEVVPEGSDPLTQASSEASQQASNLQSIQDNLTKQAAKESSGIESQVGDLASAAEGEAKNAAEKATSMLGDITGSDVLGGLGSLLGFGADLLGPILGGVGLVESAEAIAKNQDGADPYAAVRKLIAQGTQKEQALDADIASDQFASKIGGTRAPAFGSLAAPVFSTQSMAGMSGHF